MKDLIAKLRKRLMPFLDLGFWLLTLISLVPLLIIDRPMAQTLLQWCAFFLALAGASIVICRVMLPQVDLSEWLEAARYGNPDDRRAAATVVLAVCILLSCILLSMVLWARA